MAPSDGSRAKKARKEGKCNSYLHFAAVAANSAMGLRIGDDETYKFHPPVASERTRSKRKPAAKRKDGSVDNSNSSRSAKSPVSDIRGFIMHIRSGTTSTQTTNYNSVQNTPRTSISSRPPSQSSFQSSVSSSSGHFKKWLNGRSQKSKGGSKSGRQTPGFLTRPPNLDLWTGKERYDPREHEHYIPEGRYHQDSAGQAAKPNAQAEQAPQNISEPYNFQHHMHIQPNQFQKFANASHNDMVAEFSAIRAAQSARRCLTGVDAGQVSSRTSYAGQSLPSSYHATARSSMHAPEPMSPQSGHSDHAVHYVGSKSSFSMPFRDGKSPRLQQQPSTEFPTVMPISEDTILQEHPVRHSHHPPQPQPRPHPGRSRETPSGHLCSNCHSRVVEDEYPSELDGTPIEEKPRKPDDIFSTETTEGLKTGFYSSPNDQNKIFEFKKLSPEPQPQPRFQPMHPTARRKSRQLVPLTDPEEVRASMNRSSINNGLFSSWAPPSESSDDADTVTQAPVAKGPIPDRTPQQQIAHRIMQRAQRNANKPKQQYRAPATPPPISPLPQLPPQQLPTTKHVAVNTSRPLPRPEPRPEHRHDPHEIAVIEEEEESAASTSDAQEQRSPPIAKTIPTRRPSIKNVRFKTDDTLINGSKKPSEERDSSLDRVQATLDSLHQNLTRLETDLVKRPSDSTKPARRPSDPSRHSRKPSDMSAPTSPRPKTSEGKVTAANSAHRRHRTTSGAGSNNRPPSRMDNNSSRIPLMAGRSGRAKTLGNHPGSPAADLSKLNAPLPPLPLQPKKQEQSSRDHERNYSSGSATIPTGITVP